MSLRLTTPLPGRAAQNEMAPLRRSLVLCDAIPSGAVESAVLVLLFPANAGKSREELLDWSVLLTRRNSYPGVHSGQISFPGGKREATDADLWATACREASEEVGITEACLDKVGALTGTYVPASNFVISPFIAVARPEARVCIDPREVVEYRQVPVRLLDPAKARMRVVAYSDGQGPAPTWQYEGFTIWGATAVMLAELYRVIDRELLVS